MQILKTHLERTQLETGWGGGGSLCVPASAKQPHCRPSLSKQDMCLYLQTRDKKLLDHQQVPCFLHKMLMWTEFHLLFPFIQNTLNYLTKTQKSTAPPVPTSQRYRRIPVRSIPCACLPGIINPFSEQKSHFL